MAASSERSLEIYFCCNLICAQVRFAVRCAC
jgi:hypothetical protein